LNVVPILMPALRERTDDIPALARHFLKSAAGEGLPRRQLTADAAELLSRQGWRGNVRELKNFIYRMALLAREDMVDAAALSPMLDQARRAQGETNEGLGLDTAVSRWLAEARPVSGTVYDAALAAFERPLFAEVLRETGGNQLRAAQQLGINRNTLRKRLGELAIDPEEFTRRV
ncbi:MAG: nitrogen regulation protein NR(I), partial [Sphingomonadales bacterium]|nr:nitrogen regulation protein NR(I) [Sphingomonadales bacterium]